MKRFDSFASHLSQHVLSFLAHKTAVPEVQDIDIAGTFPLSEHFGPHLFQIGRNRERMEDVTDIETVNVFARNDIDFRIPIIVKSLHGTEP